MIIQTRSYPRAALIGNPSDGFFGRTIAFIFSNFSATVTLYESPELEIVPDLHDRTVFGSPRELASSVRQFGYYGGVRLIKATIKRFIDYCQLNNLRVEDRNFTVRYDSTIPHSLGLAGSSAIITACMKALMIFYEVYIEKPHLANLVLSVENEELGIPAGLQDRVAQAYEHPVYMNFDKDIMQRQGYGHYEMLDPKLFPPLFIAYQTQLSEGSEVVHNDLRTRYKLQDPQVLSAITQWCELTESVKTKLLEGQGNDISEEINRNFDLRKSVMNISRGNQKMIEIARSVGASAKFTGSGGAIIGTYKDETMYEVLKVKMNAENIKILKPHIVCQGCE